MNEWAWDYRFVTTNGEVVIAMLLVALFFIFLTLWLHRSNR